MPSPEPTEQDHENARTRAAVAGRQAEVYAQVRAWALGAFGPGWEPSHRHYLLDHDEEARVRHTGERPRAAATVHTVKNAEGRARHFTVEEGRVVAHASVEAGFGTLLHETHPTAGFQHLGKWCAYQRYSLCWAPLELYQPKSAEELAALRAGRERAKREREQKQWERDNPLWAWGERMQAEEDGGKGEDRER